MSRRDTILVAVLINAGLLIILFATALPSKHEEKIASEPVEQSKMEIVKVAPPVHASLPTDEVDQVLKQYANSPASASQQEQVVASQPFQSEPVIQQVEAPSSDFVSEAPAKEKAASGVLEVKVKKGDVLEKIARVNHCSVDEIMRLNGLSSTRLHIGQVLRIPNKESREQEKVSAKTPEVQDSSGAKYYIVKNGDSPWTIAVKNHMKLEELLRLNNLNEEKARRLKPGDKIRIK